jgi:hypothetical protein
LKNKIFLLPFLFLLICCASSALFRTPLNYLEDQMNVFPEKINGTYYFMDDSLKDAYLSSGLPALVFIEAHCRREKSFFDHAFKISTQKKNSALYYTNLYMFTDSVINLGLYADKTDTFHWNKIHDNLIEIKTQTESGTADSSVFLPIWNIGRLYFTPEDMQSSTRGYLLAPSLNSADTKDKKDKFSTNVIVKNHNGRQYLIERKDTLYQIIQYTFTPWGFIKSIVPATDSPAYSKYESNKGTFTILDSVRKVSHAAAEGDVVVFDPEKEELENLFASSWAKKENYIRIDPPAQPENSLLRSNGVTVFLALLCLLLVILLLVKRKN